jgi:hypothetical protein
MRESFCRQGEDATDFTSPSLPSAARRCGTRRFVNSTESPAERCDHSGQVKSGQLGEIFEVNAGRAVSLRRRSQVPCAASFVFELFQIAAQRKADEDNFAAARAQFVHECFVSAKRASKAARVHFFREGFLRNKARRRRRREEPSPADASPDPATSWIRAHCSVMRARRSRSSEAK